MPFVACAASLTVPASAKWSGFGVKPRAVTRTPRTTGCCERKQKPALGFVLVVEAFGEVEQAGLVERGAFGHRHAHVEVLARVTHLHVERRDRLGRVEAGGLELLGDLAVELAHERAHAAEVDLRERSHVGAHEVDHVVGDEHAERGERGRGLRHVDPA